MKKIRKKKKKKSVNVCAHQFRDYTYTYTHWHDHGFAYRIHRSCKKCSRIEWSKTIPGNKDDKLSEVLEWITQAKTSQPCSE